MSKASNLGSGALGAAVAGFVVFLLAHPGVRDVSADVAIAGLEWLEGAISQSQVTVKSEQQAGKPLEAKAIDYYALSSLLCADFKKPEARERCRTLVEAISPSSDSGLPLRITDHIKGRERSVFVQELQTKEYGVGDHEYIQLLALEQIDLSGATLGDARRPPDSPEKLTLPEALLLRGGETLRIYITTNYHSECGADHCVELNSPEGIYKGDPPETDRVWLKTAGPEVELLVDFTYVVGAGA